MKRHPFIKAIQNNQVDTKRVLSATRRRIVNLPHYFAWNIDVLLGGTNSSKLKQYKDKFQNERCFIIGNGPSLKKTNLSYLKNEITFGLNRIYLLFDEIGFSTTFHVAMNELVLEQFSQDIIKTSSVKFLNWNMRHLFPMTGNSQVHFLQQSYSPHFSEDILKPIWGGATVTYATMQLAFYMGFTEVVLIGIDHSFSAKGTPHKVVISDKEDSDHFDPRYFGRGFKWQLPDLDTSEYAYSLARKTYKNHSRVILDATIGGKLEVFPKVNYEDLF